MKLAIVASHPIQYQAPIFRELAGRNDVDLRVFFGRIPDAKAQGGDFGVEFQWDVPLLDGYRYEVFANDLESFRDLAGLRSAWSRLRRAWTADRPDVVMHSGWHHPCMFPALAAAQSLRIPCMLRCEANLRATRGPLACAWHRWILPRYVAFLPTGRANAAYYDAFGPPETPRFFSPLFSGGDTMSRAAEKLRVDRKALRRRWGIDAHAFCFLFAGKFVPKKRPADLIRSLSAAAGNVSMQVLLVGSGTDEPELKRLANDAPVPVTFAGFLNQSEMPAAYAVADCLVLPSDAGEVWGLVVNEAMACGLPAIVSAEVGCAEDLVEEGVTGMVFRCGAVHELADCLRRMAGDPEEAVRMGARARNRVRDYSAERAADGIQLGAQTVIRGTEE